MIQLSQQNILNTSQVNTSVGGINVNNVSYSDSGGQLLRGDGSSPPEHQVTIGEICVPLKEVFYITDMVVLNKTLAGKMVKCNLEGSQIMVRSSKDKLFDSSE